MDARCAGFAVLALAFAAPHAASADLPSYARPAQSESVHGVIDGFIGKNRLTLRDEHGYLDDVTMHHGFVIRPSGVQLAIGMEVTIRGHASGKTFDADEIDVADRYVTEQQESPYVSSVPAAPYVPNDTYYDTGAYGGYGTYAPAVPYAYPYYGSGAYGWNATYPVIIVAPPHHRVGPPVTQPAPMPMQPLPAQQPPPHVWRHTLSAPAPMLAAPGMRTTHR